MSDPLDDYINGAKVALGLPIRDEWLPTVKANLESSLKLARLVDEFEMPDEAEPATVFKA